MPDYAALARELKAALPGLEIRENEPMSERCSFRIGGPARLMLLPGSAAECAAALGALRAAGADTLVFGAGTNLLVPDEGWPGAALCISKPMSALRLIDPVTVFAGAGASLNALAVFAAQHSLTGLEFAHGIPGSVGGGVVMNAGAYGGETKDVLESAEFIDEDGAVKSLPAAELHLGYRHSDFSGSARVVTGAVFRLEPGDGAEIRARMTELIEKRRASQPLEYPSAGSTFKRPAGGYAAAMIDECGLKGLAVGGAMVSEKHAGFVINAGGATYADVTALMREIQERVYARFGVMLEPEVKIVEPPRA